VWLKLARQHRVVVLPHMGSATIEGRTDIIQRKGVATRLARLGGAAQVVNKIEVSEAARARASGNLAKGRRRAQVQRSENAARPGNRSGRQP